jgi:hypothetical protein
MFRPAKYESIDDIEEKVDIALLNAKSTRSVRYHRRDGRKRYGGRVLDSRLHRGIDNSKRPFIEERKVLRSIKASQRDQYFKGIQDEMDRADEFPTEIDSTDFAYR